MYCKQGHTHRLDPMPEEIQRSQIMLLAPNGVTIFFSTLEKHTVSWHISWRAPESLAAELNAKLQHPSTAQARWQAFAILSKDTKTCVCRLFRVMEG